MADVVKVQTAHAQRFRRLAELRLDPALLHWQGQALHAGPDRRMRRHDAPVTVLNISQQERIAHHLGRQDFAPSLWQLQSTRKPCVVARRYGVRGGN
jgi:hypothetical protein